MGKYLKYELKNVSKISGFALLYLAIITLLFAFVSKVDLSVIPILGTLITVLISILYVLSIAGISLAATLYIGIRFYRTLYGDEGYLNQMLPLTKSQIVFSKGVAAAIWLFVISLGGIASILIQYMVLSPSEFIEFIMNFGFHGDFWGELALVCEESFHVSMPVFFLIAIVILLVLLIFTVNSMYASVVLGQLWKRHSVIGAIVSYLGLNIVYMILLAECIAFASKVLSEFLPFTLFFIAVHALLDAGTFFLSSGMMKHRLNMK